MNLILRLADITRLLSELNILVMSWRCGIGSTPGTGIRLMSDCVPGASIAQALDPKFELEPDERQEIKAYAAFLKDPKLPRLHINDATEDHTALLLAAPYHRGRPRSPAQGDQGR
ncbi:MAG: hypothetical protein U0163_17055 [Gemmatimonadaceae bacterium]